MPAVMKKHFTIESGTILVSDPCYDIETCSHCQIELPAYNGEWTMIAEFDEERVSQLRAINYAAAHDNPSFERLIGTVGVDSGQMGVFDLKHYQENELVKDMPMEHFKFGDHTPWYLAICYITLHGNGTGLIPFGAVSSSGYGDGEYPVYAIFDGFDKGKVYQIRIVFIPEEEDTWNEDCNENDDEEEEKLSPVEDPISW